MSTMVTSDHNFDQKKNFNNFKKSASSFYSINLNQNFKSSQITTVSSKSNSAVGRNISENLGNFSDRKTQAGYRKKELRDLKISETPLSLFETFIEDKEKVHNWSHRSSIAVSTLSLLIAGYEARDEPDYLYNYCHQKVKQEKVVEKWHGVKKFFKHFPFVKSLDPETVEYPRQQDSKLTVPEVMQFKASQQLLNPNNLNNSSKSIPLKKEAEIYIQRLLRDIHGVGRWQAITKQFQPGKWLGEDDVTNLIRLCHASLPNSNKFSWLPAEAAMIQCKSYDLQLNVENFNNATEYCLIPFCNGSHFTLYIYTVKDNILQYYDPQNNDPSEFYQKRVAEIVKTLFNPPILPNTNCLMLLPEAMKQKDGYSCAIICIDIVLQKMKNQPLFEDYYNPDSRRQIFFELLSKVFKYSIIQGSYLNEFSDIIEITSSSQQPDDKNRVENKENDELIAPPALATEKNNVFDNLNNPISEIATLKKNAKGRKNERYKKLSAAGNKAKRDIQGESTFVPSSPVDIIKITKQKESPDARSDKRDTTKARNSKLLKKNIKKERIAARMKYVRKLKTKQFKGAQIHKVFRNPVLQNTINPMEQLPDEVLIKYRLKCGKKTPNSLWKVKSRIEKQLEQIFPAFCYSTFQKSIDELMPKIPDVHSVNMEKRENLIWKDFYHSVVTVLNLRKDMPLKGPIRITIAGDKGYKFSFLTGDLKFLSDCIGCQGGNATRPCIFCKTTDVNCEGEIRTNDEIYEDFVKVQSDYAKSRKKSIARFRECMRQNNSVCGEPLIKSIPLSRVAPPALHINMAMVNKFKNYMNCAEFDDFVKDLDLEPVQGRNEYNGNSCRKILQKFRDKPDEYYGPHKDVFILMAKIQRMAVARTLILSEIRNLEIYVKELFEKFSNCPGFLIGNKLHLLNYHLLSFIWEHRSWGLFSEEGIEATHPVFNSAKK
uniref:Ubiquitin-like protease family profile domain-containing protein n=1 Tax=Panagrolaimus sp. ES5 TaxID=591445 RepID=A0AC34FT23_9BILA